MEKESTAIRLKKIMSDRNLRQVDILELCKPYCQKFDVKLGRNDLSQYVSGKVEPGQKKLTILGLALNVNEAWLMGFNVPMERNDYEGQTLITFDAKSDAAQDLLIESGYLISISDNDIITVTTSGHDIVCSLHEYELVNIYESLIKQKKISAQAIINEASRWWEKIDNHLTGKEASSEVYDKFKKNVLKFHGKQKELNSIYEELSSANQDRVLTYSKNLLTNQQMEEELEVNAAHERTDSEVTKEMIKHDDDIMYDENF